MKLAISCERRCEEPYALIGQVRFCEGCGANSAAGRSGKAPCLLDYLFGVSELLREIFKIVALGTLCTAIMWVVVLTLLYFEARVYALSIAITFFVSNLVLTLYFIPHGMGFHGFGFFLSALMALVLALILLPVHLRKINYVTFMREPVFIVEDKGLFISIADWLNRMAVERAKKGH